MNILDYCYDVDFSKFDFLPRKYKINNTKTLLVGSPYSGKSTIIYQYLSTFKKELCLYLDFNDCRVDIDYIQAHLQEFLDTNNIVILVIENIKKDFILPMVGSIILSSNSNIKLNDFTTLNIYPLDFEEFILYDKKFIDEETSFNHFFIHGNTPQYSINKSINKEVTYQDMLKKYLPNIEISILKELSNNMGIKNSSLAIFNTIKKQNIKLSKDKFYKCVKQLQNLNMLFFVEKYKSKKSTRKIYLFDFILKDILSIDSNIFKKLDNMIFLELINKNKNIFYTDDISFYIPNQNRAIIANPFINNIETILTNNRLMHNIEELDIKKLEVISLGYNTKYRQGNTDIEILPFWEWAIKTSD